MVLGVVAVVTPKADKVDAVRDGLSGLAQVVNEKEPGCLRYKVTEQTNASGATPEFVVVEEYKDQAAFDEHLASEHFKSLGERAKEHDLLAKPLDIRVTKEIAGFDSK